MASGSLRRFDVQANYAMILALVSAVPGLGAIVLAVRNYNGELGQIVYGEGGFFVPSFLGCAFVSAGAAALAAGLGLSSAGQRRNERQRRSWIGFFLGSGVLTLDIILLIAFMMLRLKNPG